MSIYCPLYVAVPVSACASVHQKVAQDPPRLLAQGAKAGTPVLCIAPRPEETQQPRLFRAFSTKPGSIPRRPDLLVRIEALLWLA